MAEPARLVKSVSTDAIRPRTRWFLIVSECEGGYEVNIGYKYTDGSYSFFSAAKRGASVKHPWGPPVECRFQTIANKKGKVGNYFRFVNEVGDVQNFSADLLNTFICGENGFTRKCTQMMFEEKQKLLGNFLSLLPFVKDFCHHREEFHQENGMRRDLAGVTGTNLVENGGNLAEFLEFATLARDCAFSISGSKGELISKVSEINGGTKRKGQPEKVNKIKMSKFEVTEDLQKKEIEDPEGVEKTLTSSYTGRADVCLSNLSISTKMAVKINQWKVTGIANSIKNRFDPALLQLTVCPADFENFDTTNLSTNKYFVVSGQHSFRALEKMKTSGDLKTLVGLAEEKVSCYILNTRDAVVMHYSHLRSNDLGSKFSKKPRAQDLLFYYESLLEQLKNKAQALEVVMRYSKLLAIGADEVTVLKKLCNWSPEPFAGLTLALTQYQIYQTKDASKQGNEERLRRGETLPVSKRLLSRLAKVDQEYFKNHIEKVMKTEISLKQLIEDYEKFVEYGKTLQVLCKIACCENINHVKDKYSGKFDQEVIEKYAGAEVGENQNQNGTLLEHYYESVIAADTNDQVSSPVSWSSEEDLDSFIKNQLGAFDVSVVKIKTEDPDVIVGIADIVMKRNEEMARRGMVKNEVNVVLVLFPTEDFYSQAYQYLKNLKHTEDFAAIPIHFDGDKKVLDEVCENLLFGLLFGCIKIFYPPLMRYNKDLATNLRKVVAQVCPPNGKAAFFSESELVCIHS